MPHYVVISDHKYILLTDGCWAQDKSVFADPWMQPKQFASPGGARNYIKKYFSPHYRNRYKIEKRKGQAYEN